MKKIDLKKDLKAFYAPSAKAITVVDVPAFKFAMIDGDVAEGTLPGDSAGFQEAIQALYGISYTLKFAFKKRDEDPIDYPVMALEGLWQTASGKFEPTGKEPLRFTLMILQPDVVKARDFAAALAALRKKRGDSPALAKLRLETFREGLCMQTMHIGPYATEPETLAKMAAFAAEQGYRQRGLHHEIYMGDPRTAAPEKLKTVLRLPIEKT